MIGRRADRANGRRMGALSGLASPGASVLQSPHPVGHGMGVVSIQVLRMRTFAVSDGRESGIIGSG